MNQHVKFGGKGRYHMRAINKREEKKLNFIIKRFTEKNPVFSWKKHTSELIIDLYVVILIWCGAKWDLNTEKWRMRKRSRQRKKKTYSDPRVAYNCRNLNHPNKIAAISIKWQLKYNWCCKLNSWQYIWYYMASNLKPGPVGNYFP